MSADVRMSAVLLSYGCDTRRRIGASNVFYCGCYACMPAPPSPMPGCFSGPILVLLSDCFAGPLPLVLSSSGLLLPSTFRGGGVLRTATIGRYKKPSDLRTRIPCPKTRNPPVVAPHAATRGPTRGTVGLVPRSVSTRRPPLRLRLRAPCGGGTGRRVPRPDVLPPRPVPFISAPHPTMHPLAGKAAVGYAWALSAAASHSVVDVMRKVRASFFSCVSPPSRLRMVSLCLNLEAIFCTIDIRWLSIGHR